MKVWENDVNVNGDGEVEKRERDWSVNKGSDDGVRASEMEEVTMVWKQCDGGNGRERSQQQNKFWG